MLILSFAPCPQRLRQGLELVTTEKGWAWVREGNRLLGLQSAGGHCWLLVTAIYFKKKFRKISAKTPKFAACCCFYTQPGLWYMSHLVQKGWKRLVGEAMSLQGCNTASWHNPSFCSRRKRYTTTLLQFQSSQQAKKPVLLTSSEKRNFLVEMARYHAALNHGSVP